MRVQLRSRPASCPLSLPQRRHGPRPEAGSHSVASCAAQLCGAGPRSTGLSGPSAASGLVVGPARPAVGPRHTRSPRCWCPVEPTSSGRTTTSGWPPRRRSSGLGGPSVPELDDGETCARPPLLQQSEQRGTAQGPTQTPGRRSAVSSVPEASPASTSGRPPAPRLPLASSFRLAVRGWQQGLCLPSSPGHLGPQWTDGQWNPGAYSLSSVRLRSRLTK